MTFAGLTGCATVHHFGGGNHVPSSHETNSKLVCYKLDIEIGIEEKVSIMGEPVPRRESVSTSDLNTMEK